MIFHCQNWFQDRIIIEHQEFRRQDIVKMAPHLNLENNGCCTTFFGENIRLLTSWRPLQQLSMWVALYHPKSIGQSSWSSCFRYEFIRIGGIPHLQTHPYVAAWNRIGGWTTSVPWLNSMDESCFSMKPFCINRRPTWGPVLSWYLNHMNPINYPIGSKEVFEVSAEGVSCTFSCSGNGSMRILSISTTLGITLH